MKCIERQKLILSNETLLGIRITGNYLIIQKLITHTLYIAYSFVDLLEFIFKIPGVTSFLSERISQDPLENYFGRQRQRGGVNENPTAHEFLKNNNALRVVNSIKIDTHRGNVDRHRSENNTVFISSEPLPKKKKQSKTFSKIN